MKVLFIAGWYPDEKNVVEGVFVQEHARAAALFNEIAVIHGRESKTQKESYRFSEQKENGFPVIRFTYRRHFFQRSSSFYVRGILIAFEKLKERGFIPQVVHANVFHTARAATIIKKTYGIPFVLTEHKSRFLFPSFLKGRLKRVRWIPEATMIMPVSQTLLEGMKSHGIRGSFSVVPNTIDTDIFYPPINKKCDKNLKKMLAVARITPVKGIGDLLQALKELKKKRDDFSLDIIGAGKAKRNYEKMVDKSGLSQNVRFLGVKNKKEVASLMRQSDFFVLPTFHRETFCCVFAEAMACGLPIIGTTAWAVPEFFGNPEFGILVPPGDITRLVRAIEHMLDNCQEYDSAKIAEYSRERFSYNAIGKKFSEIYQKEFVPSPQKKGLF
ncbi:MAG: glycosyltransferase [Candidatus Omnitrophota bacterium]